MIRTSVMYADQLRGPFPTRGEPVVFSHDNKSRVIAFGQDSD
jgi:hypothetical protein